MNQPLFTVANERAIPRTDYVIVNADDWEGLYLNGKLISEDHSIRIRDVMEIVMRKGGIVTDFKFIYADLEWMANLGNFPDNLADVKEES